MVVDARHRYPSGISVYSVGLVPDLVSHLTEGGLDAYIVAERHQARYFSGFRSRVLIAPETEHYTHYHDELAETVRALRPAHVHAVAALIDPRWCRSFSTTWHDIHRFEFAGLTYDDAEVTRRTSAGELARMRAFTQAMRAKHGTRFSAPNLHHESQQWLSFLATKRAGFVATVSPASMTALERFWGGDAPEILLAPPKIRRLSRPERPPQWLAGLGRYLLFVGTPEEHKRLDLACQAIWADPRWRDLRVVVVGDMGHDDLDFRIRRHPSAAVLRDRRITRLGYVSDELLRCLYEGAFATLLPSLAEGYCLPAAEAASVGGAVLANRLPVLEQTLAGYPRVGWFDLRRPASLPAALDGLDALWAAERAGVDRRAAGADARERPRGRGEPPDAAAEAVLDDHVARLAKAIAACAGDPRRPGVGTMRR